MSRSIFSLLLAGCTSFLAHCTSSIESKTESAVVIKDNYVIPDSLNYPSVPPKAPSDTKEMKLNGMVKSVSKTSYIQRPGSDTLVEWRKEPKEITFFNRDGFMTEVWEFDPFDTTRIRKEFYRYDRSGKLLDIRVLHGTMRESNVRFAFTYDSTGAQIGCYSFKPGNKVSAKYVSFYDSNGNKTQLIGYTLKDKEEEFVRYTYKYDSFGNRIQELFLSGESEGYTLTNRQYSYDRMGRIVRQKIVTDYHQRNFHNSKKTEIKNFSYDGKGNLVLEKTKLSKTAYQLDLFGNWVELRMLYSDGSGYVVKRTIKYYP